MKCVIEYKCIIEIIVWIGMKVSILVIFIVLSLEIYNFYINWNYVGIFIF